MDAFEKQFEDIDVRAKYMEDAMGNTTASATPEDQVDALISQVADEHQLDVSFALMMRVRSVLRRRLRPRIRFSSRLGRRFGAGFNAHHCAAVITSGGGLRHGRLAAVHDAVVAIAAST